MGLPQGKPQKEVYSTAAGTVDAANVTATNTTATTTTTPPERKQPRNRRAPSVALEDCVRSVNADAEWEPSPADVNSILTLLSRLPAKVYAGQLVKDVCKLAATDPGCVADAAVLHQAHQLLPYWSGSLERCPGTFFASVSYHVAALMGCDTVTLFLPHVEGKLQTYICSPAGSVCHVVVRPSGVLASVIVAEQPKVLVLPEATEHRQYDASIDEEVGYVAASVLAVPVRTEAGLGVLQAVRKKRDEEERCFAEGDTALLKALSVVVATACR